MRGPRVSAPLPCGQELSELDPAFRDSPHASLDRLRCEAPRYLDPSSDGRRLFLTRHDDVRTTLFDRSLTRDANAAPARDGGGAANTTLLSMEGPEHRLGRKLVGRAFDARAVEARRDAMVAIVDALLDEIAQSRRFDAIADFAARIPLLIIADILGLPRSDIERFRTWSDDVGVLTMLPARTPEQGKRLADSSSALHDYLLAAVRTRRAAPGDDLISELVSVRVDGRGLDDKEIAPLCLLLLVAGNLTTTDVIGNAIVLLFQHPEQLARLRAEPGLIGGAIEEVLRFDPPVSAVARHTLEPRELFGCALPAGATLKASLIAANRDPGVFEDPHAFRIDRAARDHVSVGGGAHGCPGAALARLEASVALVRLFARFPNLKIAGPTPRKVTYGFRGFAELPLSVD
jgi:hypothetical protein